MATSSKLTALTAQIGALSALVTALSSRVATIERSSRSAKAVPSPVSSGPKRAGKRLQPPARISTITASGAFPLQLTQVIPTCQRSS
jgi:hypothetical protein